MTQALSQTNKASILARCSFKTLSIHDRNKLSFTRNRFLKFMAIIQLSDLSFIRRFIGGRIGLCGDHSVEALAVRDESDERPFVFNLFEAPEVEAGEAQDVFEDAEDGFNS